MSSDEGGPVLPTGQQFPLNSRRLSLTKLRDVAELLGLPTQASADEIRQMIEGKLSTMGYEPSNVQVIVEEQTQIKRHVYLVNEDGTIREGEKVYRDCGDELSKIIQELTKQLELTEETLEKERATSRESRLYGELPPLQDDADTDTSNPKELNTLRTELEEKNKKIKTLWKVNCQQLADFDKLVAEKEQEIIRLTGRLQEKELEPRNRDRKRHSGSDVNSKAQEDAIVIPEARIMSQSSSVRKRKGQAPPIDHFSGEQTEMRLDDWLPSLERAARWNQWTEEEYLIQLAGHLKGKALQEWNLIPRCDNLTTNEAVSVLKERLEPRTRVLAAQDFRHSVQTEGEAVGDYIRRVERTFIIAYGQGITSRETRETLLHGQLQEGLSYHIMKAPSVSGAPTYQELVMAAKNEEKRLIELRKRLEYIKKTNTDLKGSVYVQKQNPSLNFPGGNYRKFDCTEGPRCYGCGKYGHIEKNCRMIKKTESKGPASGEARLNRRVQTGQDDPGTQPLLDLLFSSSTSSDSEVSDVRIIRVGDHGSHTVCAKVEVAGVPVFGIVDSGDDITILGGELFRKIAAQSRLKKKQLRKVDKVARNYDHGIISLDGRMDLNISFNDKELNTPIYIKMDATKQLLLSEGVCRQLGIVTYHPEVQKWREKELYQ